MPHHECLWKGAPVIPDNQLLCSLPAAARLCGGKAVEIEFLGPISPLEIRHNGTPGSAYIESSVQELLMWPLGCTPYTCSQKPHYIVQSPCVLAKITSSPFCRKTIGVKPKDGTESSYSEGE